MSTIASDSAKIACRVSTLGHLLSEATGNAEIINGLSQFATAKGDRENVLILAGKLSRQSLETLALFLGISDPGNKSSFPKKDNLATRIVRRFNQLVPAQCAECDEEYRVHRSASPVLECHLCGRGAHDCESVSSAMLRLNLPGSLKHTVWLCNECYYFPGESSASGGATPASSGSRSRNNSQSQSTIKDLQLRISSPVESQDEIVPPSTATLAAADGEGVSSDASPSAARSEVKQEADNREVCKAFLEWSCSHGKSGDKLVRGKKCAYRHLQTCKSFLKFGTSEKGCSDKKCSLFHPKLCKFVQTEKCCHNAQCKLYHPFAYNKARRAAIKKRNAASKEKPTSSMKGPARNSGTSANAEPAQKVVDTPASDSARVQDFLQLQELLAQVLGRLVAVEKRLDTNPWHNINMSSQMREPPASQKMWPPPDLSYRFGSQNAWC